MSDDIRDAEGELRRAEELVAAARRKLARASQASQVSRFEPENGSVIKFLGTFRRGRGTYWFTAIRCDHYRGDRRWFVSMNNEHPNRDMLPSPATWSEIVGFASRGTIHVATEWEQIPVSRPSRVEVDPELVRAAGFYAHGG